jgi:hypothetical protein
MNDYSDIIILMGAIIVFSTLTVQVNRTMLANNLMSDRAEVDYHAVTLGQQMIEDVRRITSASDLQQFVNNYPAVVNFVVDSQSGSSLPYNVDVNIGPGSFDTDDITSYQVSVEISSVYMTTGEGGKPIVLSISKSFI